MTRFKYVCQSKSGEVMFGDADTELKLGTLEQTNALLHELARQATNDGVPWDPFNLRLTVKAQNEPGQLTFEMFQAIMKSIFEP